MSAAVVTLREGLTVGDRYRLVRPLGEGGMGVVWVARHVVTGKDVALKLLKSRDVTSVRRFLREAKIAGTLAHPGIVAVHDVLQLADGTPAMVMDLLEGESLAQRMAQGRLPADEVARMLLPVVDAVAAAHARGVVHRDLKPENVHLSPRGDRIHVTVLDFGIAKVLEGEGEARAVTQTGAVLGTPHYMAPEQIFGDRSVDGAVDVWALGVILYEALSGRRPFDGENYGQVFKAVALGSAPKLPTEVPKRLALLVARMLEHDREARPTLAEVRAVLVSVAGVGGALEARGTLPPVSSGPHPVGPRRRTVGAIGAALVVGLGLFVAVRVRDRARPVTRPTEPVTASPGVPTAAGLPATPTPAGGGASVGPLGGPVGWAASPLPEAAIAPKASGSAKAPLSPLSGPGPAPVLGSAAKPTAPSVAPPSSAEPKLPGGVHGVSPY